MSSAFSLYATPNSSAAFSKEHLAMHRINQLPELSFPTIAQIGSVHGAAFSKDEILTASGSLILPGEVVPHYNDLKAITSQMEKDFKQGMRSALVNFSHLGIEYRAHYSFQKIHLIRNVTNFQPIVLQYCALIDHLKCPKFDKNAVETFLNAPFFSRLKGLSCAVDVPLYQLACLLGETWLEEDIFNAIAELTYFRHAAGVSGFIDSTAVLPTTFLINAQIAYQHAISTSIQPRYTSEIESLRKRIQLFPPKIIAMALVASDHFTMFTYRLGSNTIKYADSLGNSPPTGILSVFQWIFADIFVSPIVAIENAEVEIQGAGSGSCGIIAHNFMELEIQSAQIDSLRGISQRTLVKPWTATMSQEFRDAALQDLLLYHHIAVTTDVDISDCTSRYIGISTTDSSILDGCEVNAMLGLPMYFDFNSVYPYDNHPIVEFSRQKLLYEDVEELGQHCQQKHKHVTTNVPLVHELVSLSVPQSHGLLPAFEVKSACLTVTAPAPTRIKKEKVTVKRRHSLDGMVNEHVVIDLCSPERKPECHSKPVIRQQIVDLCTPSPAKRIKRDERDVDTKPNVQLWPTIKQEKFVIDLCSPEAKPKKQHTPVSLSISQRPPVVPAPGLVREGAVFQSWKAVQEAIYDREKRRGHIWRVAQSKADNSGRKKKITFRCNHYGHYAPVHSVRIDPGDHRRGKSIKTECCARVNINKIQDTQNWRVTLADWEHNHPREIPEGGSARPHPTNDQKAIVSHLATSSSQKFTRCQIAEILKTTPVDGNQLEPRQITNLANQAKRKALKEVENLGGEMQAILRSLRRKAEEQYGWRHDVLLDENGVVTGIWWQSPEQAELGRWLTK